MAQIAFVYCRISMNLNDQIIKPSKYNHNSYFDHPVIASHLCYTTYSIYLRKGLKTPILDFFLFFSLFLLHTLYLAPKASF